MFYKDIDRDIKGVIKVGQADEENMKQELEEYVVTNELADHFSEFYNNYEQGINSLTDKMGVWVSGFFGSGKSHFIKILSYLLENRQVDNKPAVEFFNDKHVEQELLAQMKEAGQVPTDVVLFNIDSKSSSDSKANKDAIVKVFMKVFNEMQGFCGSIPWLADMERKLVDNGFYEDFKAEFESNVGFSWEEKRQDAYFEADAIIEALVATTDMSQKAAENWYYNAEDNYSLSVEQFAQYVNQYIEEQAGDHHVVFLVDEIGQYIGDDTGLMLNLQTVVEDLGTYCGGKAWVLVTSQQDMDSITEVKGSDFSKIQGRFDTRLSLSSANVDEVIKKRILRKTDSARESLELLYNENESILKNLITFSSDTAEMKNYSNAQDFAQVYPFIPYQFDLLQKVFEEVRLHGASGKHLSEGERSLLSAFQESAQKYGTDELGRLVPFSAFYNSIETFLDSTISRVITKAKQNSRLTEEDVEVLKLLFMIRYIDEVPSDLENIATLMISNIDEDKLALQERIAESLDRLVSETLIQKNGPEYMFLTNEEQDVNREIKGTSIDVKKTIEKVGEILFEDIYPDKRYSYSTEYNFSFNKLVDDQARGRQKNEIGVQVLTPYSQFNSEEELKLKTSADDKVIIKLPSESNLMSEIEQSLKLSTYLKKKSGTAKNESMEDILTAKSRELRERQKRIKKLLMSDLKKADFYVKGEKMNLQTSDPVENINQSFERLIDTIYNKLNLIEEFVKSKQGLLDKLDSQEVQINFSGQQANSIALEEVRTYIERQNERNLKVTMKKLVDRFSSKPYGWKEFDIAALVIDLLKAQEIDLLYSSQNVNSQTNKLIKYLTRSRHKERLIVRKRRKVEQRLINKAKKLGREVFYESGLPTDEDGLKEELQDRLIYNERNVIRDLLDNYKSNPANEYETYPGQDTLEEGDSLLEELMEINDSFEFYNTLADKEDQLLDYEEEVSKIKDFFNSQQQKYYDRALKALDIYEQDKNYVNDKELISIVEELQEILTMETPYSRIHELSILRNEFQDGLTALLEKETTPIAETINNCQYRVIKVLEGYNLQDEFEAEVKEKFAALLEELNHANDFTEIFSMETKAKKLEEKFIAQIDSKVEELRRKREEQENNSPEEDTTDTGQTKKIAEETDTYKETVDVKLSDIIKDRVFVKSEEEVEEVVAEIKDELKRHIKDNKQVRLG